jgi:pyruvate/2-oxoglutarate dehydrogenase complex dihydrolipoamide acyltransferase (E2) component
MSHSTAAPSDGRRTPATPLARAVAADLGVDLATVPGSGRAGRILRADVEAAAAAGPVDGPTRLPPRSATLPSVGAALPEPVATGDGELQVRRRLRLTLSIDHRALDGATGAGFLARLKDALEHPLRIVA